MPPALPSRPTSVYAVHLNYRSRAAERGRTPDFPSYFLKPVASLAGSGDTLAIPGGCELLAFEGEIVLVIGIRTREVAVEQAWAHVGWVTAGNDLGVYDLRYADSGSNVRSKGGDGFTPVGPELLDARTIEPDALHLRTWVNGELAQDAATGDELIFGFDRIVADLSRLTTLEVGDLILTGTPTGSTVIGPGDVVEVEVDAGEGRTTGRLVTPVAAAGRALAPIGAMPRADDATRALAHGTRSASAPGADPAPPTGLEDRFGADVVAGLRTVATATVASQLRRRGLDGCTLDGLRSTRPERRLLGTARTVRYLPQREDLFEARGGGFNAQKRAVDTIGRGEVLVIEARGRADAGTVGDILALRAQVRGAAGIVTDGAVRDSVAVAALDIPTYHAAVHPAVLGRRHVPWETDVAVACAGVLVQPGDLLVGDADGVVVVPDDLVVEVVADALEQERQEEFIVEQVAGGGSVDGLYPLSPAWTEAYQAWAAARGPRRPEGTS